MSEPDVTLTNLVIVIECLAFGWACLQATRTPLRDSFAAFFAMSALASASAAVVHGFAPDHSDTGNAFFWTMTMLAVVVASAALVFAAGELRATSATERSRRLRFIALVTACIAGAVLIGSRNFTLAVAVYVPASLWLAFEMYRRWRARGSARLLVGAAGLALAVVAGLLQQLRYTPVPDLLDHNASYHVLQIVALAAFFAGCRATLADGYGGSQRARSS